MTSCYAGALPQADLHNFTGGTFPWVANRLAAPRAGAAPPRYFFLHHQPYRCVLRDAGTAVVVFSFSSTVCSKFKRTSCAALLSRYL
ncbi:MAG: hypothetical protein EOO65_00560 [Methanosarcinales archaeon]|nr:MAG: hypothetical protein EOO65_00560 [Methanosarcinales archaeon]